MRKRYDRLCPQVASFENLLLAWRKAARVKRSKPSVRAPAPSVPRVSCWILAVWWLPCYHDGLLLTS